MTEDPADDCCHRTRLLAERGAAMSLLYVLVRDNLQLRARIKELEERNAK